MILDELAAYSRIRVERAKELKSLQQIRTEALQLTDEQTKAGEADFFRFEKTLQKPGLSFICEVKKASPSKGIIAEDFPYLDIAKDYEEAGADCVSCLTEPKWFLGSDEIFRQIRAEISLPMIRKDFTVDAYQIYEAKLMGADAVLLICALLDTETVRAYLQICDELGLSALVEAHDEAEIASTLKAGARLVGVNNRNLKNFTVDFGNAAKLREMIPENVTFVAESGVKDSEDVKSLVALGADAVLVGEALMRAPEKGQKLKEFHAAAGRCCDANTD
ncbi:MAG: indole-3-glycerol phosphate synthase TrpC [Lachnospiraceae bacterium]|nr:indole-3-glycerol phosphate synthase TrpC [Lachnospiraceae bacterium]